MASYTATISENDDQVAALLKKFGVAVLVSMSVGDVREYHQASREIPEQREAALINCEAMARNVIHRRQLSVEVKDLIGTPDSPFTSWLLEGPANFCICQKVRLANVHEFLGTLDLAPLNVALRWLGAHDSRTAAMLVAVEDATGLSLGPGDPSGRVALAKIATRLEAELPRLKRILGDAPACPLCGSRETHDHTEHALRVVQGTDGLGLDVTLTRFCRHCTRGATVPVGGTALLVGDSPEGVDAALELVHRSSVPAARARAVLRRALARSAAATTADEQAAPLVAAIETFVDRMTGPELDQVVQRLRSITQDAPRYALWVDAVLSRATDPARSKALRPQTRRCSACDEHKHRGDFSANQWKKSARRCLDCQRTDRPRHHQERIDEAADAAALRDALTIHCSAERARIEAELERRNALELGDDDCPICFETTEVPQRVVLHANHWACTACHKDLLHHGMTTCPLCRDAVCL